jgi:ABC-type lipoprotein export system ATPase subunit
MTSKPESLAKVIPSALPLVEARAVCKRFSDGNVTAVDDVSLTIAKGQFAALVGRSGCGKSTLLNLLGGLDQPTSGTILFEGRPLNDWRDAAEFRSQKLGFVFQSFHLVSVLTAEQNVQLPMFESSLGGTQRLAKAKELLALVGMSHRAGHRTGKLSGGERQRVAIARALANDPPLILADEPTGNLDTKTAAAVIELFHQLHDAGKTILMVTHDPALAAAAKQTFHMQDGRLLNGQIEAESVVPTSIDRSDP